MKAFANKRGLIAVLVFAAVLSFLTYSQDAVANTAPVACIAEAGRVIETIGGEWEARVTLDASCSFDMDDDINDFAWFELVDVCDPNRNIFLGSSQIIECNLPLGLHVIILQVTDTTGTYDTNEAVFTIDYHLPPMMEPNEPNEANDPNTAIIATGSDSNDTEESAATILPSAQTLDFKWKHGEGLPGINGTVSALTTWDPDGNGPQSELLIAGGNFTIAGDVFANNIAAWDGNSWQPLGIGMNEWVYTLTVYNGELIAGGSFTTAGDVSANGIARWDGSNWYPLGSGMSGITYPFVPFVHALMVYNGELIVGGGFTVAGGIPANNIARWNGSNWQPLGSGMNSWVFSLTDYNGDLIAGGYFTTAGGVDVNCIARWYENNWHPLESGMDDSIHHLSYVNALAVYNEELVAGGHFTTAGGVSANHIASWNGTSWNSLGSGMNDNSSVEVLTVYNSELIAGGDFTFAGGVPANKIAQWDGSSWHPLGSGNGLVYALTVYNGELIAGGRFTTAGGVSIARWNGSSWNTLGNGMNYAVRALTVYNGELIAGGNFTNAGSVAANSIARWDGNYWHQLGGGMDEWSDVLAFTIYNNELIVGGGFRTAGGVVVNRIARWDGSSWHSLSSGMNGNVWALTVYNGELIAGGDFTTAGGIQASRIARWNGISWQSLIPGGMNDRVRALTVYNGELIAGGYFTGAGGVSTKYIARWNGNSWKSLGVGMHSYVYALMVYNGGLIAGGSFSSRIARWNGSSWQPFGIGMYEVYALTVYNDELIAGGGFPSPSVVIGNRISRWDGSNWYPLGSGIDRNYVYAFTDYNNELIAGGSFTTAGGKVSAYWARWGPNQSPLTYIAGDDRIIEAGSNCEARVVLDGSCSIDEDSTPGTNNDIVSFDWYESNSLLGSGEIIECNLPLGEHIIRLEVTDESGESDSNEVVITVVDTTPPVIVCPNSLTVYARLPAGAAVVFEVNAVDLCDSQVDVVSSPASGSIFAPGETTVVCTAVDDSGNSSTCSFIVTVIPPVEMPMNFTPQVLNTKSKGQWMKAHFVLPDGYEIGDIDVNTPAILEPLGIESDYINVFVERGRFGESSVEIGFARRGFCDALGDYGPAEVTVSAKLTSGVYFYGTDTIKVIANDFESLSVVASYWLQNGCTAPDWCNGADTDASGTVDFADFALFDSCCIEVF